MALSVAGIQLKRSFELSFSASKIPIVIEKNFCQRGMSFPQLRVKGQSLRRCFSRPAVVFFLRQSCTGVQAKHIDVGQSRIREGIIWILLDRLLEIFDSLLRSVLRPLLPRIAALQVKLIRFRIASVSSRQSFL